MTDTARELYVKGMSASNAQNWESCRAALLGAWALKPHWQIAGSLGYCEIKAEKYRDAAEHLQYFITHAPANAADRVAESTAGLAEAKKHVGSLRLKVDPATASVDIDGAPLRDNDAAIFVEPGSHTFRVVDGTRSKTTTVAIAAGEEREVTLDAGVIHETPAAPAVHAKPSLVPAVIGGSLALVGIGVGVGMFAAAGSKSSQIDDLSPSLSGRCGPGAPAESAAQCTELQDLGASRSSLQTIGAVSLSVGGAATLFTVGYLIWRGTSSPPKTAQALWPAPFLGPNAQGMTLNGSF